MNKISKIAVLFGCGLGLWGNSALAGNVLTNPGFELDPQGQTLTIIGWNTYGPNAYSETGTYAHTGTNYFKVYQNFSGAVNYTGIYQDYISGPGASYAASGWGYTLSSDVLAGQNVGWLEVTFRDAGANVLALYRSSLINTNAILTGAFPKNTWVYLPVTNQYDPNSYVITNTTSSLVAPPGSYFVRYQIVLQGDALDSNGSLYFDDLVLNQAGSAPYGNWNIVWSDEFNGTTLNPGTWTFETGNNDGWGNNELEYYTSRTNNAYVAGGFLHIVAQKESYEGYNYTSARIKSEGLFSFLYGRVEWRASLPQGLGFWPALWMLGTNITSISWPGCGEIDVMENMGSLPGTVAGSMHSGSDETASYNFPAGGSVTNFHTYTIDWATNAVLFYVDGHLYESQTSWGTSISGESYPFPFNQPFFFIMNMAIGGNFLGDPSVSDINSNTVFPGQMLVDYVRIYNQTPALQISAAPTNGGVVLSWPSNIVCHLQSQSNATLAGLGTNWLNTVTATNRIQIASPKGSAFYRLESP
jgi:beta-glucanase (GH16 family)